MVGIGVAGTAGTAALGNRTAVKYDWLLKVEGSGRKNGCAHFQTDLQIIYAVIRREVDQDLDSFAAALQRERGNIRDIQLHFLYAGVRQYSLDKYHLITVIPAHIDIKAGATAGTEFLRQLCLRHLRLNEQPVGVCTKSNHTAGGLGGKIGNTVADILCDGGRQTVKHFILTVPVESAEPEGRGKGVGEE